MGEAHRLTFSAEPVSDRADGRWNRREHRVNGGWSYRLRSVQRLEAEPPDLGDTFAVEIECKGPGANAEVEIFLVEGCEDEAQIIALAFQQMNAAFAAWGRLGAGQVRETGT